MSIWTVMLLRLRCAVVLLVLLGKAAERATFANNYHYHRRSRFAKIERRPGNDWDPWQYLLESGIETIRGGWQRLREIQLGIITKLTVLGVHVSNRFITPDTRTDRRRLAVG
jgi:hypothetical protein